MTALYALCYLVIWVGQAAVATHAVGRRLGHDLSLARDIAAELRPAFWPALAGYCLLGIAASRFGPGDFWVAFAVLNWFLYRGGDDDRWKRRRRKLAEKVAVQGGRLIVAPAGAR